MTGASTEAAAMRFEDIVEGFEVVHEYSVTAEKVDAFVALFGDASPIHVDDAHARARGFEQRVAHGAILQGFLSHFVGMILPGRFALLLSADVRYRQPVYPGTRVVLRGRVAQRTQSQRALLLAVTFEDQALGTVLASGRVQVAVAEELD